MRPRVPQIFERIIRGLLVHIKFSHQTPLTAARLVFMSAVQLFINSYEIPVEN